MFFKEKKTRICLESIVANEKTFKWNATLLGGFKKYVFPQKEMTENEANYMREIGVKILKPCNTPLVFLKSLWMTLKRCFWVVGVLIPAFHYLGHIFQILLKMLI